MFPGRADMLCPSRVGRFVPRAEMQRPSPHFSHSMRPALLFRRGRYRGGRRKRIGPYGWAARRWRCLPKGNPKGRLKKPTGCVATLARCPTSRCAWLPPCRLL